MAETHNSIRVPLGAVNPLTWGAKRRAEPIRIGVPLPSGRAVSTAQIHLDAPFKLVTPAQVRALDAWPDGSIRWALVDVLADADTPDRDERSTFDAKPTTVPSLGVNASDQTITVETDAATFGFEIGGPFPFSSISIAGREPVDVHSSGFQIETELARVSFRIAELRVHEIGPVRAEIELRAVAVAGEAPIDVSARIELFAGSPVARVQIMLLNRRRAAHPNGQWVLGDEGSVYLRSAALVLTVAGAVTRVACAPECGSALADVSLPFEVYQESSGGDHWDGPIHRNREARVPLRFRGYRLRSGDDEHTANRASPIVVVHTDRGEICVTVPGFWENFPRAISVDAGRIEVGLFPGQSGEPHELQGGEQKTHEVVVAFARDPVSDPPLAWCHDPMFAYPSPEWCCGSGAVPYLIPASDDPNRPYLSLVLRALDPATGFAAKNERADEYGWRNFGDLHADHESAFQPPDRPFVSHYNNQYDTIAGFATHFLRTGDSRWWRLMTNLARHVRDIDIYHTREDKAAYNGGLFWHTCHYTDAGTATHRTYPRGAPGGGPSSEHNYNAGLMLHYFMTGERESRDTAIGLGRWVIDMDDGRQTPFRWLARGATGIPSATGSMAYHGPGRAPANSILACLVAARLTKSSEYTAKADELIRRCIHPEDDVEAGNLHDVERRWYYTVFLQTLGWYLHFKGEQGQFDHMYAYARQSLLRYARWMATHERPYLDRPDVLEFPTETWAAQDMRKADVFLWAAQHATGDERARFLERAQFFFAYSVNTLAASPTGHFTRPVALLLANGWRDGWVTTQGASLPALPVPTVANAGRPPAAFQPQRTRAIRRAGQLAFIALFAGITIVLSWIL
ncbi:MAG TPA: hypothetical protein VES67_15585 [Vicinamibacterales bacterium]|nr:hypothetical protein [Vicinamibacterales bacterium]